MQPAIVLNNVTKTFGPVKAVQDLDLVVRSGGLCGFIRPNGAGKTTSIGIIMSIIFPDSGEISILTAKVFRIGLLMYGKPPNLSTLIRWARAA